MGLAFKPDLDDLRESLAKHIVSKVCGLAITVNSILSNLIFLNIEIYTAFVFLLYCVMTIWLAVLSTLVAGLNKLRVQLYGYLFSSL